MKVNKQMFKKHIDKLTKWYSSFYEWCQTAVMTTYVTLDMLFCYFRDFIKYNGEDSGDDCCRR